MGLADHPILANGSGRQPPRPPNGQKGGGRDTPYIYGFLFFK